MSDARATILDRIRRSRTGSASPRPAFTASLPVVGDDLVSAFASRARKLASDVLGPVPAARAVTEIANYLATHALPPRAVCWPALTGLGWTAAGIVVESRPARGDDLVGITGVFCAIAETGTLMLLSGADTPATVSLLPETHIALLPVSRIVARMEDSWALLRHERGALPRAVNFVSGPSRTADIEQTVTLGAHGPYRVLIVLTSE
jgi:L-lactate dehydrogenase complex protein LldG